jgi:hypothetical protein
MGQGSSQPTTTTVNQNTSSLPAYMQPYVTALAGQAQAASREGYTPYAGQRLAGFTGQQQQVQNDILGQQTPEQFGQASTLTGLSGLGALTAGQRYAQMGGPQSFTQEGMAQQYMSPYMQNVLDVQKQQAIRDAQQGQLVQNLGAARQGTYGGARQLLAGTERERNLGSQLGQIQATGQQAAYDAAQRQFNAEQQAQMQNQQFGANLGLQGLAQAGQAGQTLGNIGSMQQQADLARLNQQQGTAAQTQALQQQQLDQQYQDFLTQRGWNKDQISWLSSIIHGIPYQPNTTTTSTTSAPGPSIGSQLVGAGLGAAGIYKALG